MHGCCLHGLIIGPSPVNWLLILRLAAKVLGLSPGLSVRVGCISRLLLRHSVGVLQHQVGSISHNRDLASSLVAARCLLLLKELLKGFVIIFFFTLFAIFARFRVRLVARVATSTLVLVSICRVKIHPVVSILVLVSVSVKISGLVKSGVFIEITGPVIRSVGVTPSAPIVGLVSIINARPLATVTALHAIRISVALAGVPVLILPSWLLKSPVLGAPGQVRVLLAKELPWKHSSILVRIIAEFSSIVIALLHQMCTFLHPLAGSDVR